jgi:hypothetical protein
MLGWNVDCFKSPKPATVRRADPTGKIPLRMTLASEDIPTPMQYEISA